MNLCIVLGCDVEAEPGKLRCREHDQEEAIRVLQQAMGDVLARLNALWNTVDALEKRLADQEQRPLLSIPGVALR